MLILVTGGAGFIGSHLTKRLRDDGHEVRVLDAFVHGQPQAPDDISFDVRDLHSVLAASQDCDFIVHLASIAGVGTVGLDPMKTMDVAFNGTKNVLMAAMSHGIPVINFSSSEVYGKHAAMVTEDAPTPIPAPTHTRWGYGAAKLAAEHLCQAFHQAEGVDVCTFRIFNTYGPGQLGDGAVRNFMRQADAKELMHVRGDGASIRTWCHVDDTVGAVIAAMDVDSSVRTGETFNIGNPHTPLTTRELAETVGYVVNGKRPEIAYTGAETDVRVRIPDVTKARNLLGWRPVIDLVAGLQTCVEQ